MALSLLTIQLIRTRFNVQHAWFDIDDVTLQITTRTVNMFSIPVTMLVFVIYERCHVSYSVVDGTFPILVLYYL